MCVLATTPIFFAFESLRTDIADRAVAACDKTAPPFGNKGPEIKGAHAYPGVAAIEAIIARYWLLKALQISVSITAVVAVRFARDPGIAAAP